MFGIKQKFRILAESAVKHFEWLHGGWRKRPDAPPDAGDIVFRQKFSHTATYKGTDDAAPSEAAKQYTRVSSVAVWYWGGGKNYNTVYELKVFYWIPSELAHDSSIAEAMLKGAFEACPKLSGASFEMAQSKWEGYRASIIQEETRSEWPEGGESISAQLAAKSRGRGKTDFRWGPEFVGHNPHMKR
jgi:hypothetical protein